MKVSWPSPLLSKISMLYLQIVKKACEKMSTYFNILKKSMDTLGAASNIRFTWEPSLSVGDEKLDGQHQQLLKQVNLLLEAISGGKNNLLAIGESLKFLDHYIDEHFLDEEMYMQKHQYPQFEEHRALHVEFITRYSEMKNRVLAFDSADKILLDLENHLARWWIDHIGKADKQYAKYIETHELS